ncbi:MAG TPA: phosphoglucomutase (alpha-D-glucose-1,6-bisphosphate-dependent) [Steroidobacteraceae bacterium]|nr:phosphoglucomutase (alpha-D-glucose-1,6-bisphosphate-dependent) [Steroidobacteraceae bacterium]
MSPTISPLAGKPAPPGLLADIPRLVTAYFTGRPDPAEPAQRVAFGTSGHRGSSLDGSFTESHVLAITQAICEHRRGRGIDGPLYLGFDTHALSAPAFATALEVLAANGVEAMCATGDEYTPTPAISHAILTHNRGASAGFADGIVITPSHNPPESGGFKYNPPNGGPADTDITSAIEARANRLLEAGLEGVRRMDFARARHAATTHAHDYLSAYVEDLGNVLDMEAIRGSALRLGADPLGGAGVHYWSRIADRYRLPLEIVSDEVDPTFRFMSVDWDGRIRMDPSSSYAMQRLIGLRERYDVAFACDTDHDRHGIVVRSRGLLPSNHYLAVAIDYLFAHRPAWRADAAIGKTIVSSSMIDRVAARLGRKLFETPVGFKWFAGGLADGSLGFGGEESAGAAFARIDGGAWTTDKDGIASALLAAEIAARTGRDPGECYAGLERDLGPVFAERLEAPANPLQKERLAKLTPERIAAKSLAGEPISAILTHAPANGAAIGGVKLLAAGGWFAARPSGTENIYKIYAESLRDETHLRRILEEAQAIVDAAIC